ncbi:hypothetical protein AHAS_Ahas02G0175000 [Arachis hypogaea]
MEPWRLTPPTRPKPWSYTPSASTREWHPTPFPNATLGQTPGEPPTMACNATSRHRSAVFESGSEENRYHENENENEDEEVDEARSPSGSPREDKDQIRDSAPEIRDVFGDFDDDEEEDGYVVHHDIEHDSNVSACYQ